MISNFNAINSAINCRIETRSAQTLIGICSGLIADDELTDKEISYLQTWIQENSGLKDQWPASQIIRRIEDIKSDGIITEAERDDLIKLLKDITQNNFSDTGAAGAEGPALPIDNVTITFTDKTFCFTGEFMYGTRNACQEVITKLGAVPIDGISKN